MTEYDLIDWKYVLRECCIFVWQKGPNKSVLVEDQNPLSSTLFRGSPENQEFKGSLKTLLSSQPNWFYDS